MLLFVRESARVNVWEWIQASLDPDIDLFKEAQFTGGLDPEEVRVESDADMARSQLAAKKLALEAAGYTVPVGEGVTVLAVSPSRPAADVLKQGDVLLQVDGKPLDAARLALRDREDAQGRRHGRGRARARRQAADGPGADRRRRRREAGHRRVRLRALRLPDRRRRRHEQHRWSVGRPRDDPLDLRHAHARRPHGRQAGRGDRNDLRGRSVGEIGGISQKATSAKAAGAEVFIVPACTRDRHQEAECETRPREGEGAGRRPAR